MYIKRGLTAGELIEKLQETIADLSEMSEDEIICADITIQEARAVVYDVHNDHSDLHGIDNEEFHEAFSSIPPHVLCSYLLDPEDYAKDNDYFYESLRSMQTEIYQDVILKYVSEDFKEKHGIEE